MATEKSERMRAEIRLRRAEVALEDEIRLALRRTFDSALSAADEAALPKAALVAALSGPNDLEGLLTFWRRQVDGPLASAILSVYRSSAREAVDRVPGLRERLGASFFDNIRNIRADLFMARRRNKIVDAGAEMFDGIMEEMRTSLEAGEGVPKAAARVREKMGDLVHAYPNRATTIARTEAASAVNGADADVAKELQEEGIVTGRQWLATDDVRTRESHREADGQVVYGEEKFTVGGASLEYPGDANGPADEVINCRCTTLLVLADE